MRLSIREAYQSRLPWCGDAVDEAPEGGQLGPEMVVEALCHLLDVPRSFDFGNDLWNVESCFFVQSEGNLTEALQERVTTLPCVVLLFAAGLLPAALAFDPLPYLQGFLFVGKNHQMLESALDDLAFYFPARGI